LALVVGLLANWPAALDHAHCSGRFPPRPSARVRRGSRHHRRTSAGGDCPLCYVVRTPRRHDPRKPCHDNASYPVRATPARKTIRRPRLSRWGAFGRGERRVRRSRSPVTPVSAMGCAMADASAERSSFLRGTRRLSVAVLPAWGVGARPQGPAGRPLLPSRGRRRAGGCRKENQLFFFLSARVGYNPELARKRVTMCAAHRVGRPTHGDHVLQVQERS